MGCVKKHGSTERVLLHVHTQRALVLSKFKRLVCRNGEEATFAQNSKNLAKHLFAHGSGKPLEKITLTRRWRPCLLLWTVIPTVPFAIDQVVWN